jgi:hypothetical protein
MLPIPTGQRRIHGLREQRQHERPQVDEERPELVVEGKRVLQDEDEQVAEDQDSVADEKKLRKESGNIVTISLSIF